VPFEVVDLPVCVRKLSSIFGCSAVRKQSIEGGLRPFRGCPNPHRWWALDARVAVPARSIAFGDTAIPFRIRQSRRIPPIEGGRSSWVATTAITGTALPSSANEADNLVPLSSEMTRRRLRRSPADDTPNSV